MNPPDTFPHEGHDGVLYAGVTLAFIAAEAGETVTIVVTDHNDLAWVDARVDLRSKEIRNRIFTVVCPVSKTLDDLARRGLSKKEPIVVIPGRWRDLSGAPEFVMSPSLSLDFKDEVRKVTQKHEEDWRACIRGYVAAMPTCDYEDTQPDEDEDLRCDGVARYFQTYEDEATCYFCEEHKFMCERSEWGHDVLWLDALKLAEKLGLT